MWAPGRTQPVLTRWRAFCEASLGALSSRSDVISSIKILSSVRVIHLVRSTQCGPIVAIQGYLAHKKLHPPLGPLYDPRHRPTVGS